MSNQLLILYRYMHILTGQITEITSQREPWMSATISFIGIRCAGTSLENVKEKPYIYIYIYIYIYRELFIEIHRHINRERLLWQIILCIGVVANAGMKFYLDTGDYSS